ncbi:hypothetical protein COCOBI_02-8670 [Coccomyxa sp. Obi]|nr:hypothetical protein COCOBI_02-8670 [Coccomyxa sp. Obi]
MGRFDVTPYSRSGEHCSFSGCRLLLRGGHPDIIDVVRSVLSQWPSGHSLGPVYFTAGEDAKICAWPPWQWGRKALLLKEAWRVQLQTAPSRRNIERSTRLLQELDRSLSWA